MSLHPPLVARSFCGLAVLVGALSCLALGLSACSGPPAEGLDRISREDGLAGAAVPVETLQLTAQSFDEQYEAAGVIEAEEEVTISAEIPGRVTAVHREVGDRVRAGQALISLDDRSIQAQVQKLEAQLSRAETQLDWARRDLERQQRLFRDQVTAERAMDDARRLVDTSQDDVSAQRAELAIARVDLDRSRIRSPIAGQVAARHVAAGEYVTPGEDLYDLVATDIVKFVFSVAERDVTGVRSGDSLTILVDAHPGRSFEGKVSTIAPAGSDRTRTFRVELELANNAESPLLPGMSGRARVVRAQYAQVVLIPEAAILRDGASSYIFTAEKERAERRNIEILSQTGSLAVVDARFAKGSSDEAPAIECIILGQAAVVDGGAIRIRRSHLEPPRLAFD